MSEQNSIIKVVQEDKQTIMIVPPKYGQVNLTFHEGKLKTVDENRKTQYK
ncbi:hypothetical protein [Candidatus Enterococcus courvalinii]|uniref:Uncharacterized protein n=1 Tax=Candidatus Enterococcus courvalinii TaxID=2815329 RepID=A0ABS3I158_9ENTE|nr:hypothetical protein [Enterococcus sp. MSG2901]MBO0481813.1 hypothetical protein [Enterococcus sp. MSG2901]